MLDLKLDKKGHDQNFASYNMSARYALGAAYITGIFTTNNGGNWFAKDNTINADLNGAYIAYKTSLTPEQPER